MKRLEIVLIGHSRALDELAIELEAHGHLTHRLPDAHALENGLAHGASLLVDDGTLALTSTRLAAFKTDVQLGLRIGLTLTFRVHYLGWNCCVGMARR